MPGVHVLFDGYAPGGHDGRGVAGTVSLIRAGDATIVVDPGMVPDRSAILDPLAELAVTPEHVTDVVLSHHHPDHTINVALFPHARVHDHWATYHGDRWISRHAEGVELAPGVRLTATPGHSYEDITTLVEDDGGVVALTHLWWHAEATGDARAVDLERLHHHRERILELATTIVPGHGPAFPVTEATPR